MSDWTRVAELFHGALDLAPQDRDAYLNRACGEDAALRREVASLLAHHDRAASFLERPASFERSSDGATLVGRRVGQYSILRRLGRGGMGVVYLAEDTRLARMVALKALAPAHTLDDNRRERLRREARAAAALAHPGIATVYALEEIDDQLYIASEYVPGETLRDELARGPLPRAALVDTALQIARAAAAAHERGVIHRDLKPENVMRAPDGRIKILDFGLARFARAASQGVTEPVLTDEGAILGTPAYMAPEQLRGWEADARADIFAFGVLVFELAAGSHPFAAATPASVIARTLESEPADLATLAPQVSPALAALIRRSLAKDRDARPASMRDVIAVLEQEQAAPDTRASGSQAPAGEVARAARRRRMTPRAWWQVHQVWVGVTYVLMLLPLWIVKDWVPRAWGTPIFVSAVVVGMIAANLRWHLWFASRYYSSQLAQQRARFGRPIAACDVVYAALLLAGATAIVTTHVIWASFLAATAIGVIVALTVIEPTTTRAAFGRARGRKGSGG